MKYVIPEYTIVERDPLTGLRIFLSGIQRIR